MFKHALFEFTAPICDCNPVDIGWTIHLDDQYRPGLDVYCRTCGTRLRVAHSKFIARIRIDSSTEELQAPAVTERAPPKLDLIPGGKLPVSVDNLVSPKPEPEASPPRSDPPPDTVT